jgi:hypothetical protein
MTVAAAGPSRGPFIERFSGPRSAHAECRQFPRERPLVPLSSWSAALGLCWDRNSAQVSRPGALSVSSPKVDEPVGTDARHGDHIAKASDLPGIGIGERDVAIQVVPGLNLKRLKTLGCAKREIVLDPGGGHRPHEVLKRGDVSQFPEEGPLSFSSQQRLAAPQNRLQPSFDDRGEYASWLVIKGTAHGRRDPLLVIRRRASGGTQEAGRFTPVREGHKSIIARRADR